MEKYYFTRIILVIILLHCIFITHCKFNIIVHPKPKINKPAQKIPLKVGIYIDKSNVNEIYSRDFLCLVGAAHTWNIPIGKALKAASLYSFKQVFTHVKMIRRMEDFNTTAINIIFKPLANEFGISQIIKSHLFLRGTIVDKENKIIYQKEVKGKTKSLGPSVRACCFGVFMAQGALSNSATQAIESAFEKLFIDMMKNVKFTTFINKK